MPCPSDPTPRSRTFASVARCGRRRRSDRLFEGRGRKGSPTQTAGGRNVCEKRKVKHGGRTAHFAEPSRSWPWAVHERTSHYCHCHIGDRGGVSVRRVRGDGQQRVRN